MDSIVVHNDPKIESPGKPLHDHFVRKVGRQPTARQELSHLMTFPPPQRDNTRRDRAVEKCEFDCGFCELMHEICVISIFESFLNPCVTRQKIFSLGDERAICAQSLELFGRPRVGIEALAGARIEHVRATVKNSA
jgi:hypothetical protein